MKKTLLNMIYSFGVVFSALAQCDFEALGPDDFNQASYGRAEFVSMAIDGSDTPYVVYSDALNGDRATVMKYSSGTWAVVGTVGFSAGVAYYTP